MSTQGIRNIILRLKEEYGDTILSGQAAAIALAEKEVEAIERAAKAMHRCDIIYPTSTDVSEIEAAVAVFASIAKDAP